MTAHRDLKNIVRQRQKKTGESYTAARVHTLRAQSKILGVEEGAPLDVPVLAREQRVGAIVLKVNAQSVRASIPAEGVQVTFRSSDVWEVAPGQVATLVIEKRWTWRGDAYASGRIEDARIDIAKLGLTPLPLSGGELHDLRSTYEPYRSPDPYAPFWRKLTAKPRASYEMDPIAWGAFPDAMDFEDNPTCDAAELAEAGEVEEARAVLMGLLLRDLRCIDAHAHLGKLVFERSPARALIHYEVGVRIAELSLPAGFDGLLEWGRIYNRPFLRCLHGYGLCLWRLGRATEAQQVFERILSLNPNDNQGVRALWHDLREGASWEESAAGELAERDVPDRDPRANAPLMG